jgi:hypothetical protein
MPKLNQPVLGIVATAITIVVSLGFIKMFTYRTFADWVGYCLMCIIPIALIIAITWEGGKSPAFVGALRQPAKGIVLLVIALLVGTVAAVGILAFVGGRITPPAPMANMFDIFVIDMSFLLIVMFGGWPFTSMIKNRVAAALPVLVACYVVGYLLFRVFFNFEFMKGAPVYVPALDPHGLSNAFVAIGYATAALCGMFVLINFDLWPLTKSAGLMRQPTLGVVWTLISLVFGAIATYIGYSVLKIDVVVFLVRASVAFIFGTIVVQNMLQGSLFAKFTQPMKGILNNIACVVIGGALCTLYGILAPVIDGNLAVGPPTYELELWIATALLGVTFPIFTVVGHFELWPLARPEATLESHAAPSEKAMKATSRS